MALGTDIAHGPGSARGGKTQATAFALASNVDGFKTARTEHFVPCIQYRDPFGIEVGGSLRVLERGLIVEVIHLPPQVDVERI